MNDIDESFDNIDLDESLKDLAEISDFEETFNIYEKECLSILKKSGWNNQELLKVAAAMQGVLFDKFGLWEEFPYSADALTRDKKENSALCLLTIIREIKKDLGKSDSKKAMRMFQLGRQFKVAEIKLNMDDVRTKFNDAKNKLLGFKKRGSGGELLTTLGMIMDTWQIKSSGNIKNTTTNVIKALEEISKHFPKEQEEKYHYPLIIQCVDRGEKKIYYTFPNNSHEKTIKFKTVYNAILKLFPKK
ncbi:MAG: hypothetical protein PH343_03140 [Nitrospira sp.]|nr:hypothetical protein [Nitrospira sp.]